MTKAIPVIELANITKEFDGEPPIRALDGIDLQVFAGEMVAIIGPSGSGKSTLLNIMGTLDRPTSGTVRIDGTDTGTLSDRQLCGLRSSRLGFVFQSFHLIETATTVTNVANGLLYQGTSSKHRTQAALDALNKVGLAQRAGTRPSKLSGGQRQRVAIARALVSEPSLILADEPTGNLDTSTSADILSLLEQLNTEHGATIAVITHDHEVAARLPRRIEIRDGKIETDTQPHAVGQQR